MKRILCLLGIALAFGVGLGSLASRSANAQENLKSGKVISRTDLKGAPGWEAILVERMLPPGVESGKHTQAGNEIVYIQEGSVIFEAQGKPAVTVKAGEAFTTRRRSAQRENASSSAPPRRWPSTLRRRPGGARFRLSRTQVSLRDAVLFCSCLPGVETPGYFSAVPSGPGLDASPRGATPRGLRRFGRFQCF